MNQCDVNSHNLYIESVERFFLIQLHLGHNQEFIEITKYFVV